MRDPGNESCEAPPATHSGHCVTTTHITGHCVTTIQMGTCPRLESFGEIPRQLIDTFASFPRPLKCIHTVTFQLHIHMAVIDLFFSTLSPGPLIFPEMRPWEKGGLS